MRAIALAFQCGRGDAVVEASRACAGAPRRPEVARRGGLSLPAATRLLRRRRREPIGGQRRPFGSEVPA
jgi:hypothetical protein